VRKAFLGPLAPSRP